MLYFSLFLAGFTLGIFVSLKLFAPERAEESWDPQHFPQPSYKSKLTTKTRPLQPVMTYKASHPGKSHRPQISVLSK